MNHPDPARAHNDAGAAAEAARLAIHQLRFARNLLRDAGARRAADRVRRALASAGGALRHFERKERLLGLACPACHR